MKIIEPSVQIINPPNYNQMLHHIETAARTCYKSEDKITDDSAESFIERIIDKNHLSVCEHCNISVRFICDRGVSHELVRHRLCSFCLSGDTAILRFNQNRGHLTIKELYDRQQDGQLRGRNKLMLLRSMNEDGKIVPNSFKQIIHSGNKATYQVNTALGYTIRTSKDHIFFTPTGEIRLKNLNVGDEVYVNGIELVKDPVWLKGQRDSNQSIQDIADKAGVAYSTIRKYIKLFGLQTPLGYKPDGFSPWNKGLSEDDDPRVKIQGDALRTHHHNNGAGPDNSCWRDSDLSGPGYRLRFSKYPKVSCEMCGSLDNLENHHRDKDVTNWRETNKLTLCTACHKMVHLGYNVKHVVADIITSIDYHGEEDTYDIEMNEPFHNFVANGFVVHNSQESTRYCRYSDDKFGNEITVIRPVFWNENSDEYNTWKKSMNSTEYYYFSILEKNNAPQEARAVLPNSLKTDIVVTANIRQWRTMFEQRCASAAHPQMRQIMLPLLGYFMDFYPVFFSDMSGLYAEGFKYFANKGWQLAEVKNA